MGLGSQVVYFCRLHLLDDSGQAGGVRQIAVMECEPAIRFVGVLIEVVNPVRVEEGGAALDSVNLIAFFEQKFGQIRAVLAGDAGD
jgi:hypothetical protein